MLEEVATVEPINQNDRKQSQAIAVIRTVTASETLMLRDDFILADTSAASITVTLPNSICRTEMVIMKTSASNTLTIATDGELILNSNDTSIDVVQKGTTLHMKAMPEMGGWGLI